MDTYTTAIHEGNIADLTASQVTELAKPFTNMLDSIAKFYENPKVKKGFEEWHLKKFGRKPNVKA